MSKDTSPFYHYYVSKRGSLCIWTETQERGKKPPQWWIILDNSTQEKHLETLLE